MNVTLNRTDSLNAVITVEIAKTDYEGKVDNSLKDLRKNAVIPGFRKGMVPPQFLRQKYGKSVLMEEINKLMVSSLENYLKENNSDKFLGEPLPAEGQTPIDLDTQEDFIYKFDIGISPKINVKLSKEDQLPYYLIQVTDETLNSQIESFQSQFGVHEQAEEVEGNDLVKGRIVELDEKGEPKADGIVNDNAMLLPQYMKNEDEKKKFIDAKLHSTVIFNPHIAYDGNEAELSSFFNIKKEEAKTHTGDFSLEISEISRFKKAELNQELFDKVLGEGKVDSEDAFKEKVKEDIAKQFTPDSDYKFLVDALKRLEEKASGIQLPEAFLKRWLLATDSKRTPESVEEDFPKILEGVKTQLTKEHLIEENGITLEDGELEEYAKQAVRSQFARYGMYDIPDDALEKYAREMLQKKDTYRSLGDRIFEDKLIKILKEQVTLEPQEITYEEFSKLLK
jgi:trigger factor